MFVLGTKRVFVASACGVGLCAGKASVGKGAGCPVGTPKALVPPVAGTCRVFVPAIITLLLLSLRCIAGATLRVRIVIAAAGCLLSGVRLLLAPSSMAKFNQCPKCTVIELPGLSIFVDFVDDLEVFG